MSSSQSDVHLVCDDSICTAAGELPLVQSRRLSVAGSLCDQLVAGQRRLPVFARQRAPIRQTWGRGRAAAIRMPCET